MSIVFIISLNFAFASDNINDTALSVDDDSSTVLENSQQDILNAGEGSFTELYNYINSGQSQVTLNKSYVYNSSVDAALGHKGIEITKAITIDGNGYTIDANHLSRAFIIKSSDVVIKNVTFINGNANFDGNIDGGAIRAETGHNLSLIDCTFIDNTANYYGGAVDLYHFDDTTIVNCSFSNNSAGNSGGAVYETVSNNTKFENCTFVENTANLSGGAIRHGGYDPNINVTMEVKDCNFTKNAAIDNAGGAIEISLDVQGSNMNVTIIVDNVTFDNNSAGGAGGAMYIHPWHGSIVINNSNFTNNYVTGVTSTTARSVSGGAVVILSNAIEAPSEANITGCNFNNNSAFMGGALDLMTTAGANFTTHIANSTFFGNKAVWGGAIILFNHTSLELENVNLSNNRANATSLSITVDKPESYYPSNVTVTIDFTGKNNIANAIWNGGNYTAEMSGKRLQDIVFSNQTPDHVRVKNVTYEEYRNGTIVNMVTPDYWTTPVEGAENSQNGTVIWQDPREDDQNITLVITRVGDTRANDVVYDEILLTDIYGNVTEVMERLKPGHYIATATHYTDSYYTEISNSVEFDIYDIIVSKVTETPAVYTGDIVNYTISVYNNGPLNLGNVTITDNIPKGFVLYSYSAGWSSADNKTFTYDGILNPNSTITLRLSFNATKPGDNYLNVIIVSTNETENQAVNATENVTVDPVANLILLKDVDKSIVKVGDKVKFTIVALNLGPDSSTNVRVHEVLPKGLKIISFKASKGSFNPKTGVWNIGDLKPDETVTLTIIAEALFKGQIVNSAYVESDTYDPDLSDNNDTAKVIVEDLDKKVPDESLKASASPQKMYATGNPIAMVVLALLLIVGTSLRRKD